MLQPRCPGMSEVPLSRFHPFLHRNPLHDIALYFPLPPVVESGGARIGVAGQVLHVVAGHALLQQIGERRDAEGVRGVEEGHAEFLQAPFYHAADIVGVDGIGAPCMVVADGAEEEFLRGKHGGGGGVVDDFRQILADRGGKNLRRGGD